LYDCGSEPAEDGQATSSAASLRCDEG